MKIGPFLNEIRLKTLIFWSRDPSKTRGRLYWGGRLYWRIYSRLLVISLYMYSITKCPRSLHITTVTFPINRIDQAFFNASIFNFGLVHVCMICWDLISTLILTTQKTNLHKQLTYLSNSVVSFVLSNCCNNFCTPSSRRRACLSRAPGT